MRFDRRVGVVVLVTTIGCSRYEWVSDIKTPQCRNRPAPILGSLVPIVTPGADSSVVIGLARELTSELLLSHATFIISTEPVIGVRTDSAGRAELPVLPPGRYLVTVLRIGYSAAQDSVTFPLPSGARLEAKLEAQMLDGPCSGFAAVRVRKPWWKFW